MNYLRNQTDRGNEIEFELHTADMRRDLIRCLAEYIVHLEERIDLIDRSPELGLEQFKYYEK